VITRNSAIDVLTWILVAPITRTIRGIPTEIPLDHRHGLPVPCVASFDNLQPIRRAYLTGRAGSLVGEDVDAICHTLRSMADC
jgi:mRNA interferase MazF